MQAASTESVVDDGVEPRGALPLPPTDSGETDSNCGARDAMSSKGAGQFVCRGRACTEDSFSAPFSFPFFSSSSSSISALTFVSTSSSRSYLLETFVDLTSPVRSVFLREFETSIQSGSPYASNARWGQSVGPQTYGTECGARRRVGLLLWKLLGRDGPAVVALRVERGMGSQSGSAGAGAHNARRSPPGRAPESP